MICFWFCMTICVISSFMLISSIIKERRKILSELENENDSVIGITEEEQGGITLKE